MTDINIPVTEDELHAYVDGELPEERRATVEAWLATHPDDAARVASWRAMNEELQTKYAGVADEAIPKRLMLDALARPQRRWILGAMAATLVAFAAGGGIGWMSRGTMTAPSAFASFTGDALQAHRLYVVEVSHPVEVTGSDREHLQQWLSQRCGYKVRAPELDTTGLKLVGGRLLPGPGGPAAFLMYENQSGERFTIYASRATSETTQMRYTVHDSNGALFWVERGIGYVVSGPTDRERLWRVARQVYDHNEKAWL